MPALYWPRAMSPTRLALALLAALFTVTAPASAAPSLPDLYIEMPAKPYNDHVAPVYVDAFEQPGRLLYRFDTVVANRGGLVDVFRNTANGHVIQAIWPNGVPSPAPDPNVAPTGDRAKLEDRSSHGARFEYVVEPTHSHFHYQVAAAYKLLVPGRAARKMPKIGFCMHDTYAAAKWFEPDFTGSGPQTWCAQEMPGASFVRMGLSNGAGDLYDAATEEQWVDVTGVSPGRYTIEGTANPGGAIHESNRKNNTFREKRTVPGVIAPRIAGFVAPGGTFSVQPATTVVAPEIPARESADCMPGHIGEGCYTRINSKTPQTYALAKPPAHGSAAFDGSTVSYTPTGGNDSFLYTSTDGRGLVSQAGRVSVTVTKDPIAVRSAQVRRTTSGGGVVLDLAARSRVTFGISGKTRRGAKTRTLGAGRRTIALGKLARGRSTVRLTVKGGGAHQTVRLPVTMT